jgi:hypothetical protein
LGSTQNLDIAETTFIGMTSQICGITTKVDLSAVKDKNIKAVLTLMDKLPVKNVKTVQGFGTIVDQLASPLLKCVEVK